MNNNVFDRLDSQDEKIDQILDLLNASKEQSAQSPTLQTQIAPINQKLALQKFFALSKKEYHYFGDQKTFSKDKLKTLAILFGFLILGIVTSVLTSFGCGIYTTFTFVENLWLILEICLITHVIRSKRFYQDIEYSLHSYERFEPHSNGLYHPAETKRSYRIIKILSLIAAGCNVVFLCMKARGAITVWAIIFEVLFFASVFLTMYFAEDYFCLYSLVYFTGRNESNTQTVTVVYEMAASKLYPKEDFEKRYPFLK